MEYYSDSNKNYPFQANLNSSCNVLLISVPFGKRIREPLGLAYVAASLRQNGIPVSVFYNFSSSIISDDQLLKISSKYNVIGFSATTPSFPKASSMARLIKKNNPSVCTVLGGYHGTFCHENVMKKHPEFDVVIRGEGEVSFVEYLRHRYGFGDLDTPIAGVTHRFGSKIIIGHQRPIIQNLDSIPPPALDLIHHRKEFRSLYDHIAKKDVPKLSLISSRGCYGKCTFCSITKFYGNRKVRCHSVERAIDDVERAVSQFGVECIHFSDDHFLASLSRAEKILKGIHNRGIKIIFKISSRADQIIRAKEYLPTFFKYGLRCVEIGVENFSQTVLDQLGKGLSVKDNIYAIDLLNRFNFSIIIDFILFNPWIKFEDLEENLNYIKTLPSGIDLQKIIFSKLNLNPGTDLFDKAIAEKLYTGDINYQLKPVYKYPEVEEIHSFLISCKQEGKRLIKEKETNITRSFRPITFGQAKIDQNASNAKMPIESMMKHFNSIQTNKITLNLFEKVISLKKTNRGRKMPIIDLQNIKDSYLTGIDSIIVLTEETSNNL
jgi:radical SAM superfamily enzyme YgiQ (UPF0313 family)